MSHILWNFCYILIVQHILTEQLSTIIVTLFLLNYCHVFIALFFWNCCHILIVQHILTEQLAYIVVTQTLNNYCYVLIDIYIIELLLYINCPIYPNRADGTCCCQTNHKILLPCIECHISYGIADICKLFNIP